MEKHNVNKKSLTNCMFGGMINLSYPAQFSNIGLRQNMIVYLIFLSFLVYFDYNRNFNPWFNVKVLHHSGHNTYMCGVSVYYVCLNVFQ
jgi:hypothetical protein